MKRIAFHYGLFVSIVLLLSALPHAAFSGEVPEKGKTLPHFELPSPISDADLNYLGVKEPTFRVKDVNCKVLLVEIIGVYCPQCYKQAPLFNTLHSRIEKKGLADKVKMLAIAAGGTGNEVEHLRKTAFYSFPVVKDEAYAVHKLLGETRTPFTMLVNRDDGKVLFSHLGIIEDTDGLLQQIQDLVK